MPGMSFMTAWNRWQGPWKTCARAWARCAQAWTQQKSQGRNGAPKDSILAGNDQTLASLTSVSQQLETMIPHLQTAKESGGSNPQEHGRYRKYHGGDAGPIKEAAHPAE